METPSAGVGVVGKVPFCWLLSLFGFKVVDRLFSNLVVIGDMRDR